MRTVAALLLVLLAGAASGCGGTSSHASTLTPAGTTTTGGVREQPRLESAVRLAVKQNFTLSLYVLWHNEIPAWASRSTGGPALAALRTSAASRRGRGIRIRPITTALRIQAIRVDPSYMTATAIADSKQRVRPYESGNPQPRPIAVHERARLTLKRVGSSQRFIVWKAVSIP